MGEDGSDGRWWKGDIYGTDSDEEEKERERRPGYKCWANRVAERAGEVEDRGFMQEATRAGSTAAVLGRIKEGRRGLESWLEGPLDGIDLVRLKMRLGTHSLAADRARTANEDSYCRSCGEVETLHHFLFECLDYEELRKELLQELGELGVESELVRALKGGEGLEESEKVALVLSMSWPKG